MVALSLGGCLGRNPADTTGSIGPFASVGASDSDGRGGVEALGRRYEAEPGNAANAVAYGQALRARGQTAQSLAVLQGAAMRNPSDMTVLAAYGRALADGGRLKEAADVLARAHRPERPDWRILSVQGAVADQMGQFANAQRYYEVALKIAPGEPSILSNQGLSFALARRLDDAERVLREAARDPRADERVRRNLALVMELKGKAAMPTVAARRPPPAAAAFQAADRPLPAASRPPAARPDRWEALRQLDEEPQVRPARQAALGD